MLSCDVNPKIGYPTRRWRRFCRARTRCSPANKFDRAVMTREVTTMLSYIPRLSNKRYSRREKSHAQVSTCSRRLGINGEPSGENNGLPERAKAIPSLPLTFPAENQHNLANGKACISTIASAANLDAGSSNGQVWDATNPHATDGSGRADVEPRNPILPVAARPCAKRTPSFASP